MIYVFTGNGKGKTTAALGAAVRAVGEGKKVLMIQLIKGPWKSGEDIFISNLKSQISKMDCGELEIIKTGIGFVGILGDTHALREHQEAAENGLNIAEAEIKSKKWDIVILDEVNNAVALDLIPKERVLSLIECSKDAIDHLILTGRDAPKEFIERADLVTEMIDRKHPFEKGLKGRRGLEY